MIQIEMTAPGGVTLDTEGKFLRDSLKVVPKFDFVPNAKMWEVEIIAQANKNDEVMTDPWLAEHRTDENLLLAVIPYHYSLDAATTMPGGIVMNFANIGEKYVQYAFYRSSSGVVEGRASNNAVTSNPVSNASSFWYINESGGLVYNSTNYLQPGGTLKILAWLV